MSVYSRSMRFIAAALLVLLTAACTEVDSEQASICQRLIPWFERSTAQVEILRRETDLVAANAIIVYYRAFADSKQDAPHWISCRFGGKGFAVDRLKLIGVANDREGELSPLQLELMRALWLGLYEPQFRIGNSEPVAATHSALHQALYFLQLVINAVSLSCVYGLLAIGYTLVFSIIGKINLAFGDMAMLGAYATILGITAFALVEDFPLAPVLIAVLVMVAMVGAVYGWLTERIVFRPLRGGSAQAPLIATIGLSIFLEEYIRLAQGSRDQLLQPVFNDRHILAATAGFEVSMTSLQLLIPLLTLGLYAVLAALMKYSVFGRAQRACAEDAAMAALCGVDVNRIVMATFMLGTVCAAVAGYVITIYYGVVNFHMGFLLGFKALAAAIVGGIGSVPGALLGGVLIGVLEIFWSGYFSIAYKDIAVFAMLALFLIFRPRGLFG